MTWQAWTHDPRKQLLYEFTYGYAVKQSVRHQQALEEVLEHSAIEKIWEQILAPDAPAVHPEMEQETSIHKSILVQMMPAEKICRGFLLLKTLPSLRSSRGLPTQRENKSRAKSKPWTALSALLPKCGPWRFSTGSAVPRIPPRSSCTSSKLRANMNVTPGAAQLQQGEVTQHLFKANRSQHVLKSKVNRNQMTLN